jgi:arabinogalactan oligomer / maltooligosaccharide transport system permease protein
LSGDNPPRTRRILVGLAIAALIGAGSIHAALTAARSAERKSSERRIAVVRLQALAQALDRVGVSGDSTRALVNGWDRSGPPLHVIRVAAFEGISLEASTADADVGPRAPPRRLEHGEKPLYDQGQRLRAAVETNRQEGAPRKDEIETTPLPDGGLALAAPLQREGEIVGMVAIETNPPAGGAPGTPLLPTMLAVLAPVVGLLVVSRWIQHRAWLAIVAAALLLGSLAALGRQATLTLSEDRIRAESEVAKTAIREEKRATAAAREWAAPETLARIDPIDIRNLDVDAYRRPLRRTQGDTLERDLGRLGGAARSIVGLIAVVSLVLFLFVGLGAASRLAGALRRHRQAYTYVLPAMAGMLVLVFFPFIYGVILSFTDSTLFNTDKSIPEIWVGLRNYGEILGDFAVARQTDAGPVVNYMNFYWTLFNTILWTVSNVAIGVVVGLALALILNTRGLALRPIYRVLLILPWAMPNYITALIWRGMFHQQFGIINQVIQIFGGTPVSWFDSYPTSFATALATNGWLSFPFMMVVSLGALQSVPHELYEAARIDGATRWQRFRTITMPSLKPALVPAIILSVVWTFNMFNIVYLVTQGEPGSSTEILITQSYKYAFERYRYGYAAAYSTVIFGILLIYGMWQNRASRATENIA